VMRRETSSCPWRIDVSASPGDLLRHYEHIHASRMRGLPLLNPALCVAVLGFRPHAEDQVGVLLTPWFMNLIVLPGDGAGDAEQGDRLAYALPGEVLEMTVHCDETLGRYLSAVLYRDVSAIPDMHTARRLAADILARLFAERASPAANPSRHTMSRRALFVGSEDG
jgi:[NiFe] hydrogenase assembly HybE family chaperone